MMERKYFQHLATRTGTCKNWPGHLLAKAMNKVVENNAWRVFGGGGNYPNVYLDKNPITEQSLAPFLESINIRNIYCEYYYAEGISDFFLGARYKTTPRCSVDLSIHNEREEDWLREEFYRRLDGHDRR